MYNDLQRWILIIAASAVAAVLIGIVWFCLKKQPQLWAGAKSLLRKGAVHGGGRHANCIML